jgi:hypothetical protein
MLALDHRASRIGHNTGPSACQLAEFDGARFGADKAKVSSHRISCKDDDIERDLQSKSGGKRGKNRGSYLPLFDLICAVEPRNSHQPRFSAFGTI